MSSTIYKLFMTNRCRGDENIRTNLIKEFVAENSKMGVLINIIKESKFIDKTYVIEKYIDNEIRWRKLGLYIDFKYRRCSKHNTKTNSFSRCNNIIPGDLTTTWEKYIWDESINSWRISNFRYTDEVVVRCDDPFVSSNVYSNVVEPLVGERSSNYGRMLRNG